MKKILLYFFLIVVLASCFHDTDLSRPESIHKSAVLDFLDRMKGNTAEENVSKIDALASALDFRHVKTIKSPLGQQVLVVPVSLESIEGEYRKAIFYLNFNSTIEYGQIIGIDPKLENFSSSEKLIEDILNNRSLSFTGKFSVYSVYQDLVFFNSFNNGKINVNGKVRPGQAKSGGGRTNGCTAWYLTITYYYSDGSKTSTTEYIGTTCDCEQNSTRANSTMCGGGGEGGSSGGGLPGNPTPGTLAQVTLSNGVMHLMEWQCDDAHCFWADLGVTVPAPVVEANRLFYHFLPISPVNGQQIFGPDGLYYNYNAAAMVWEGRLVVISKDPVGAKIAAIATYLKCFDKTKAGKVTIFSDQPKPGTRDTWAGNPGQPDVGHTFVSIEQSGVIRVFGYYPTVSVNNFSPRAPGMLVDDSGHVFDVKVEIYVNASQLSAVINAATSYGTQYDLNTYNCTDFGMAISKAAGVILPDTQATWVNGGGSNPGDLGEDMRNMNSGGNIIVTKTSGYGPTLTGNCN